MAERGLEPYLRELEEALRPYGLSVEELRGYIGSLDLAITMGDYETISVLTALFNSVEWRELWERARREGIDKTRILEVLDQVFDPKKSPVQMIVEVGERLGIPVAPGLDELENLVQMLREVAKEYPPKVILQVLEKAGIETRMSRLASTYKGWITRLKNQLARIKAELNRARKQLRETEKLREEVERYKREIEELKKKLEEAGKPRPAPPKPAAPPAKPAKPMPPPASVRVAAEKWAKLLEDQGLVVRPEFLAELAEKYGLNYLNMALAMLLVREDLAQYLPVLRRLGMGELEKLLDEYVGEVKRLYGDYEAGRIGKSVFEDLVREAIDRLVVKYIGGAPRPAKPPTPPTVAPKPAPPTKPAKPKPAEVPGTKELMEAIKSSTAMLPDYLREKLRALPTGPMGEPPVLLYQAWMSEPLRRALEARAPRVAEAVRLVASEIPSELENYVWYPLSNTFYRVVARLEKRTGKWEYRLQPITPGQLIGALATAYRRATRLSTPQQQAAYATLRRLQFHSVYGYLARIIPSKRVSGFLELLDFLVSIGIPKGTPVDEARRRYKEVTGYDMPKEMIEVLKEIGWLV